MGASHQPNFLSWSIHNTETRNFWIYQCANSLFSTDSTGHCSLMVNLPPPHHLWCPPIWFSSIWSLGTHWCEGKCCERGFLVHIPLSWCVCLQHILLTDGFKDLWIITSLIPHPCRSVGGTNCEPGSCVWHSGWNNMLHGRVCWRLPCMCQVVRGSSSSKARHQPGHRCWRDWLFAGRCLWHRQRHYFL